MAVHNKTSHGMAGGSCLNTFESDRKLVWLLHLFNRWQGFHACCVVLVSMLISDQHFNLFFKGDPRMELIRVNSSAITAVGYDPTSRQLQIVFKSGKKRYTYCSVPQSIYTNFRSALSIGRFYYDYIKDRYSCV